MIYRIGSGKILDIIDLTGEQRRWLIDTQQVYEAWRAANQANKHRFAGSMRWVKRAAQEYLLRKTGKAETSLGPRGPQTEAAYAAFTSGRDKNTETLVHLAKRLDDLAPVNRAMGIGRLPTTAARILRLCDDNNLLGEQLLVVGTNAVFAYEAMAGVQVQSGMLATGDIDLLLDARRHMTLASEPVRTSGLIGLLKKIDTSFTSVRPRAFRAANKDGYLVDLIRPEARDVFRDRLPTSLTDLPDDLEGAAIFGLAWLINSPRVEAVAIDERGYPARIVAIDPRSFALHKFWLSAKQDRDPVKATRDKQQAQIVATLATRYLRRSFESADLEALPNALRQLASALTQAGETGERSSADRPNW
jgi:hypothetical protein